MALPDKSSTEINTSTTNPDGSKTTEQTEVKTTDPKPAQAPHLPNMPATPPIGRNSSSTFRDDVP